MSTIIDKLLIVKPFNPMFIALFILGFIILWVLTKILKNANEGAKRAVYIIVCIISASSFFAYKYALSVDQEFNLAYSAYGGFNWWQELPLHLCNIHMLLMPIAVATKKRSLLMALAMPAIGFSGYSILTPRILGFYGTHIMVIVEAIALYTLGFYKPEYKDIPRAAGTMLILATIIFGINLVLKFLKLCPNPNYFFLMDPEGNPILELFKSYIPYPFLYAAPCILILLVYMLIVTFIVQTIIKRRKKNAL